jgi:hypothetical protein
MSGRNNVDDETILIRPPMPPRRSRGAWWIGLVAAVGLAVGLGGVAAWRWWLVAPGPVAVSRPVMPPVPVPVAPAAQRPGNTAVPAPMAVPAGPAPVVSDFPMETLSVAAIRAYVTAGLSALRVAENASVLVLDFASLPRQGRMLDRIAALVEKGGLPHDRILTEAELAAAVKVSGDTEGGFYYGHDYSAASLQRFFAVVDRDHVVLNDDEALLRRLLTQIGWLAPGARTALISVPKVGADAKVTQAVRDAILTHELSHGEYFSDPFYAAYVHRFWQDRLTDTERSAFRSFLGRDGYDEANEEVVENETQAYLVFTLDQRFFDPSQVAMTPERRLALRSAFWRDMPPGWLRDMLGGLPPPPGAGGL